MEKKKEIVLTDEEKMKKKMKFFKDILSILEALLIVPIVITVIILITGLGQFLFMHKTTFLGGVVREYGNNLTYQDKNEYTLENENEKDLTWKDIKLLADKFIDRQDGEIKLSDRNNDIIWNITAILILIFVFVDMIMYVLIMDNIVGIFKEIVNIGSPFTEKAVKNMKKMSVLSILLFLLGVGALKISLMAIIIIISLTYIWRYGYKLQKESDETL